MSDKEFERQIENNLIRDIAEFNNSPEYTEIRQLYKANYSRIKSYIEKSNPKLAVEDIAMLNPSLNSLIVENILLLKEINKAIVSGKLPLESIV